VGEVPLRPGDVVVVGGDELAKAGGVLPQVGDGGRLVLREQVDAVLAADAKVRDAVAPASVPSVYRRRGR
jgi:hypothetical protein